MQNIIEAIQAELHALEERHSQLQAALDLVRGQSLLASQPAVKAAEAEVPVSRPFTRKSNAGRKGTGTSATAKRRKRWKASPMPWVFSKNALPFTQNIYKILEDGKARSIDEVERILKAMGTPTSNKRIYSSLKHMQQTGRLMLEDGKWRRKYMRQTKEPSVSLTGGTPPGLSAASVQGSSRAEVAEKLSILADQGKLIREQHGEEIVYKPIGLGNAKNQ